MKQIIQTECGNLNIEVSRTVSLVKDYPKQLPDDTYKIYWVCEPRAMLSACGNLNNNAIKAVASSFDAILTYDDELLELPNAHNFVYGTCWLRDNMSGADYEYRDKKELEINELNTSHQKLKNEIELNQKNYEKLIDDAADEISSFVEKANSENLS